MTSTPPPPWQARLSAFSVPPSRSELRNGHILFLSYASETISSEACASLSSMLGISDSRDFRNWFATKVKWLRGKESEVVRARNADKVALFYNTPFVIPSKYEVEAVVSPLSVVIPARDLSPPPSRSVLPPLAATPSTILNRFSDLSTASPSTLSSSHHSVSSHSSLTSQSQSVFSPTSQTLLSSPSSSHIVSPSTVTFSPPHSSFSPSIPPSSPSSHPPTKAARISIPGATPVARAGRLPLRPPTSTSTPGRSAVPDVTAYWKKLLKEKAECLKKEKKLKRSLGRDLRCALRHLGVSSVKELPKVVGSGSHREQVLEKEVARLKRKLTQSRPLPAPVASDVFQSKTSEGFLLCVKYASLLLASLGVPDSKQGKVMDIVAQMLDVRISETPGESTVRSWIPALSAVSRIHAAEMIDGCSGGMTLLRDETTKKGDKIQQHAVSLAHDRILFLGFTGVVDKSALVAFDALRAKVESLSPFSSSSHVFLDFVLKIKNLMSDRASTETLFNKVFKSVRDSFLELQEGWESLTPEEKKESESLLVHFCQLHAISNLWEIVQREFVQQESEHQQQQVDSSSAGFAVVIREVPRYLAARSAGGHREHREWKEWCGKAGILDSTVPALLGHRFNIQFLIAARVFMLRDSILEFIRFAPTMAVLSELLQNELVLAQLQILGLLDQKITGPLWRVAENAGIIEAGQFHRDFLAYVDACIDDPAIFFSVECPQTSITPMFELFKVDGALLKALVCPNPSPLARSLAVRVLRSVATYLRDVLSQTVDGGEYSNPSTSVAQCLSSAPTTNRAVESAFAYMDYLYRKAPNMRFYRRDAITCFVLNHTSEWLNGKGARERTSILERAFESRGEIVCEERAKAKQLGDEIVSKMEARKVENDGKAVRSNARKSKISRALDGVGLLTSESDIDCSVLGLADGKAINRIKDQLRFRQQVLGQPATRPGLYKFSEGGVPHTLETLISHLRELVCADVTSGALEDDDFHSSFFGRTLQLTCEVQLSDGTVLRGMQKVVNIVIDPSGETLLHLEGSSGLVFISRQPFEDLISDGVVYPF